MKIRTRMILTAAVVALILGASTVSAKPEFSKKEKKACVTCHVKLGSKDLNDTGKCYKDKKLSLEGCDVKPDAK